MTAFPAALRAEIASVEAALQSDPRFARLMALQAALSIYDAAPAPQRKRLGGTPPIRQKSEGRELVEEHTIEYLTGRTKPTPVREIYGMLTDRGVRIGGAQPTSNLSAILSKHPGIVSHGRKGWTLRKEAR